MEPRSATESEIGTRPSLSQTIFGIESIDMKSFLAWKKAAEIGLVVDICRVTIKEKERLKRLQMTCCICGKELKSKKNLLYHMKAKHLEDIRTKRLLENNQNAVKTVLYPYCKITYIDQAFKYHKDHCAEKIKENYACMRDSTTKIMKFLDRIVLAFNKKQEEYGEDYGEEYYPKFNLRVFL